MTRIKGFVICLAVIAGTAFGATPPPTVNYEGVLRDQNGNPLSGTYDMVFRFMDAATGGSEILVDQHLGASARTEARAVSPPAAGRASSRRGMS